MRLTVDKIMHTTYLACPLMKVTRFYLWIRYCILVMIFNEGDTVLSVGKTLQIGHDQWMRHAGLDMTFN